MSLPPHEQDVVDVLEASHRAFWLKDADAFRRHNLAKDFCFRWMYWQPGGVTIRSGWDQIGQPSLQHIERLVRPLPEFAEAPMANLRLRVGTEMAWASFDRTFPHLPEIFGQGPNGVLHNVTILERHDGAWKIVGQCLYDAHLGDDTLVEVDTDGRIVWASEPASTRLGDDEIFVVRVGRLRSRNQRLDTRLQAAIRTVSVTNGLLMPQRRSLPLVFEAGTGLARTIWVLAEGGRTFDMLEDRRPVEERLAQAAVVYDLSAAQLRLAVAVCQGISVPEFVRQNRVSRNTARTHLNRVFEKVGVSSQPLLVRALLSLTPPR